MKFFGGESSLSNNPGGERSFEITGVHGYGDATTVGSAVEGEMAARLPVWAVANAEQYPHHIARGTGRQLRRHTEREPRTVICRNTTASCVGTGSPCATSDAT